MSTTTFPYQPKKILDQMLNLRKIAKEESWELAYDEDNDQLYFAPQQIPKGTRLVNLGGEFALYLDAASNIKGLFIEYFKTNFTEHEKEYKKIVELLDSEQDGFKTSSGKNRDEVRLAEDALGGEAFKSVYAFFEKLEATGSSRASDSKSRARE